MPGKTLPTGLTVTFPRNLAHVPTWALPPLARHRMKTFGQYSIMLCAKGGSNTEFQHIGSNFLPLLSASAFLVEAAMHKARKRWGLKPWMRIIKDARYDLPCSCGANECFSSYSVTGRSANSERSLELQFCQGVGDVSGTANLLNHSYTLIDLVLGPQRPRLQVFDLLQALPSCYPLRRRGISGQSDAEVEAHDYYSAPPLERATTICVVAQVRGHPPRSVSTDTLRLDWTSCHANHSTCLWCFRKNLSSFRTLAQSDMHKLDIRLQNSLLANCTSTLSSARKLTLASVDLYLYASSWSNSASSSLISTLLQVTSDPPAPSSPSSSMINQVDMPRIRFVLGSGLDPLHDPI